MATIAPPPPKGEKRPTRPGPNEPGGPGGSLPCLGGDDRPGGSGMPDRRYYTGAWVGLGGIVMIFAAFSSAYVVRKGLGGDWEPVTLPSVIWLNTVILVASSFTLEKARQAFPRLANLKQWWLLTAVLGTLFLVGQLWGWRQLSSQGIYVNSNPSSSFFYLLTATHAVHLLGGVAALFWLALQIFRGKISRVAVDVTSLYWHFMDGLWIYLLLLLSLWR